MFFPIGSPLFVCFAYAGGDEEIRTLDPLLAGQVLSQLSYTPRGFFLLRTLKIEQRMTLYKSQLYFSLPRVVSNTLLFFYLDSPQLPLCLGYFRKRMSFDLRELSP